ncbi:MAG: ATP-binding protein [Dehalococcoidia bacterium]
MAFEGPDKTYRALDDRVIDGPLVALRKASGNVQRSARNPLIVGVLRDYGYVDARGMGVRNKIIPLMLQQNQTEPEFVATEDHLRVVLRRRPEQ